MTHRAVPLLFFFVLPVSPRWAFALSLVFFLPGRPFGVSRRGSPFLVVSFPSGPCAAAFVWIFAASLLPVFCCVFSSSLSCCFLAPLLQLWFRQLHPSPFFFSLVCLRSLFFRLLHGFASGLPLCFLLCPLPSFVGLSSRLPLSPPCGFVLLCPLLPSCFAVAGDVSSLLRALCSCRFALWFAVSLPFVALLSFVFPCAVRSLSVGGCAGFVASCCLRLRNCCCPRSVGLCVGSGFFVCFLFSSFSSCAPRFRRLVCSCALRTFRFSFWRFSRRVRAGCLFGFSIGA